MAHTATDICNAILAGKTVTLRLGSEEEAQSLLAHLRVIKSRMDKQFKAIAGESISGGMALAVTTTTLAGGEGLGEGVTAKFFLAESKRKVARTYSILEIAEE